MVALALSLLIGGLLLLYTSFDAPRLGGTRALPFTATFLIHRIHQLVMASSMRVGGPATPFLLA